MLTYTRIAVLLRRYLHNDREIKSPEYKCQHLLKGNTTTGTY